MDSRFDRQNKRSAWTLAMTCLARCRKVCAWCCQRVWQFLKWYWRKAGLTGSLSLPAMPIALVSLVYQTLPDPPRPRALLVCTTDGLPDLQVVCDTSRSTNFHRGFIDFGDGSDAEIETDIRPPVPIRFVGQAWKEFRDMIGIIFSQNDKDGEPEDEEDGLPIEERFVQGVFHHQYKRAGQYEIRLLLEGDEACDSMSRVLTLKKSDPLAKMQLVIEDLELEFKDDNPTRRFEFRIMQMLRSNRIFFPTTKGPHARVLQTNGATTGWMFTEGECTFNLSPDLKHDEDYSGRIINKLKAQYKKNGNDKEEKIEIDSENGRPVIVDTNDRVRFSYTLSTSGWFLGRPYVQFDGVVKCEGTLKGSINGSVNMETARTRRHGIIEVEKKIEDEDGEAGTENAGKDEISDGRRIVSLRDIGDSIQGWRFRHRQRPYCSTRDNPLDPIAIRCCGVEVSLAEWQPEDWPAKAWLDVTPLTDGGGTNDACDDQ